MDLQVEVPRVPLAELRQSDTPSESTATVRQRVIAARASQLRRSKKSNAALNNSDVEQHCALSARDCALLERAVDRLGLSARAYHRILRVARTIADLGGDARIATVHLTEAIHYRRLDRH